VTKPKLRVIKGGQDDIARAIALDVQEGRKRRKPPHASEQLRSEILRGLGACLPDEQWGQRRRRDDVHWLAQQFDRDHIAALVAACALLEAFGDRFIAVYFARRNPRLGWPLIVRILAPLALQALQGANRLAGRQPRKSFGRPNGPLIMFIYNRLACILDEDRMPTPENILQRLKRTTPKRPARGGPSRRKRA
jgi:hypothetical protein